MSTDRILFNRPYRARGELANLEAVLASDHSHGDGPFTASATAKLRAITEAPHALLTTSCTSALEMAGAAAGAGAGRRGDRAELRVHLDRHFDGSARGHVRVRRHRSGYRKPGSGVGRSRHHPPVPGRWW